MNNITVNGPLFKEIRVFRGGEGKSHLVMGTIKCPGSSKYYNKEGALVNGAKFFDFKYFTNNDKMLEWMEEAFQQDTDVCVSGSLRDEQYTKDGETRNSTFVMVNSWYAGKGGGAGATPTAKQSPKTATQVADPEDPFFDE